MEIIDKRENWVDALKGIAICGVIMAHTGGAGLPSWLGRIGSISQNGVQMFFLISGFLLFSSFKKYVSRVGYSRKNNAIWILQRYFKIIPLYYLSLLIGIILGGNQYWLGSEKVITIGNIISHITFTHGFCPHYIDSIIGVEWYLGDLAIFYIFIPFLAKRITSLEKSIVWFCIAGVLCWLLICSCNWFSISFPYDEEIYSVYLNNFCFINQLPVFLLGIVLYFFLSNELLINNLKSVGIFSYILLAFSFVLILGMAFGSNIVGLNRFTLFGILFFILVISIKINKCKIINNRFFAFLGKNSLPIYLFHYYLIYAYDYLEIKITEKAVCNWFLKYFLIVFSSAILAIILDKIYNEPMIKRLSKLTQIKQR